MLAGHVLAAALTAIGVYLAVAGLAESYSAWPDTSSEWRLYGILVAVVTAFTFIPSLYELSDRVEREKAGARDVGDRVARENSDARATSRAQGDHASKLGLFVLGAFVVGGGGFAIGFTLWAFHSHGLL